MSNSERDAVLAGLRRYRARLVKELDAISTSISLIGGDEALRAVSKETPGAYTGMSAQAAAKKLLMDNPGKKYSASEARKILLAGNVDIGAKPENISSAVTGAFARLAKIDKEVHREKENGVFVYWFDKDSSAPKSALES